MSRRRSRATGTGQPLPAATGAHLSRSPEELVEEVAKLEKEIEAGGLAVFCEVKQAPFGSRVEIIELRILVPCRWGRELQERLEKCVDAFGVAKGVGRTHITDEGSTAGET